MSTLVIPNFVVTLSGNDQAMTTMSYELSYKRTINLFHEINGEIAETIISELYSLDDISHQDIVLRINSPGGSVSDGLAIIDAINYIQSDVITVCTGMAASMAAVILASGTKGKRFITPFSEVMIHQPLGVAKGQASDISRMCEHMLKTKSRIADVLTETTGKTKKKITADMDRDYWLDAHEAINYGIADKLWVNED